MRALHVTALILCFFTHYAKPFRSYHGRALLVVDMQGCFLPGGALPTQLNDTDNLVRQINALRRTGNFNADIFTQDWHPENHVSFAHVHHKKPLETVQLSYSSSGQLCEGQDVSHAPQWHSVPCTPAADHSSGWQQPVTAALAEHTVEQVLWPPHCIHHSKKAQLHPGLLLQPEDLLVRKGEEAHLDAYSAFYDNDKVKSTGLGDLLRHWNISSVVVAGVALEYCVLWSALDAAEEVFETTVVLDATAPVSSQGAAKAVQQLQQAGVKIEESIWSVVHSAICPEPLDQLCRRHDTARMH